MARRFEGDRWWAAGYHTVGAFFRLPFRLRYEGAEHIPEHGPAILTSNHISVLDPIIIALAPSDRGRTVRFLAAEEAFHTPVIGWGLRRMGQIPIRRGARDRAALREIAAVISRGALTGIFPEGHVQDPGELGRLRSGLARIALEAQVPVIPVGIWGTHLRWSRSGFRWSLPLRPAVATVFGRPIPVEGLPADGATVRATTARIAEEMSRLLARAKALQAR